MNEEFGVKGLRLKFAGESELLFRDLNFTYQKGEKILFLGPSGCGKSTLLQVLSGLIPQSVDVPMKADWVAIPSAWGYVFQDPDTQFCMPYVDEEIAFVLENLGVPRAEMDVLIRHYLAKVDLHLPDLHTQIHTLSGGMKQRVAIASVLALQPDVLFLDEPTSFLDPEGTDQVWRTIRTIGEDQTLIIIEHKLEGILDLVERIVLFGEEGNIIADGPKVEILSTYQMELQEHGIWYPDIWEDVLPTWKLPSPEVTEQQPSLLALHNFTGFHGKKRAITIEQAEVHTGEWIAIIGENGAGKSSLLHALMQLIRATGNYYWKGKSITRKQMSHFAFVFQNPELQFVTHRVFDEIAYGLRLDKIDEHIITERVTAMLNMFHLTEQTNRHPYQLSMGQKRRLSVAASIIQEQEVILLDEPTFGLDAKSTFAMLQLLEQLRGQGKTILMVTHSMEIARYLATRVWRIAEGRLVEDQAGERGREEWNGK